RADHIEIAGAAHFIQRECAVLAAGPGDQRLRLCHQLTEVPGRPARGGPPGCRRFTAGAGLEGGSSHRAPMRRTAASARRSPLSQAPSTVPHNVSCVASPAKNTLLAGSLNVFRNGCAPGGAADIAPCT